MIALNYHNPAPIYEQLKEGLRRMILTGALATNEKLPSVRELAAELAINPNTIQRAYRELEAEGFVYTVQGKGSFAAALAEVDGGRRDKLMTRFGDTVSELLRLGVSQEELKQQIEKEASQL